MRLPLLLSAVALLFSPPLLCVSLCVPAAAEECTGENCTPPATGSGKHDCEQEKKDQTVS